MTADIKTEALDDDIFGPHIPLDLGKVAKHWRVTVEANGTPILAIEPEMLAGEEMTDEYEATVAYCSEHLASFVGHYPADIIKDRDLLKAETESLRHRLNELLCVIHRDGGHYIAEHGEEKALADAHTVALTALHEAEQFKARCAELEGRARAFRSAAEDAIVALDRTKRQSDAIAGLYVLLDPPSDRIESCRPFSFAEETVCEMVERLRSRALTGGGNG